MLSCSTEFARSTYLKYLQYFAVVLSQSTEKCHFFEKYERTMHGKYILLSLLRQLVAVEEVTIFSIWGG